MERGTMEQEIKSFDEKKEYAFPVVINNISLSTNINVSEFDISILIGDIGIDINGITVSVDADNDFFTITPPLTFCPHATSSKQAFSFQNWSYWNHIKNEIINFLTENKNILSILEGDGLF